MSRARQQRVQQVNLLASLTLDSCMRRIREDGLVLGALWQQCHCILALQVRGHLVGQLQRLLVLVQHGIAFDCTFRKRFGKLLKTGARPVHQADAIRRCAAVVAVVDKLPPQHGLGGRQRAQSKSERADSNHVADAAQKPRKRCGLPRRQSRDDAARVTFHQPLQLCYAHLEEASL